MRKESSRLWRSPTPVRSRCHTMAPNALTPIKTNTTMKTGKVKFFNDSKGFGFIIDDETGKDYFVHVSGLIDEIRDEDSVTFDLQEGKKGLNAVEVKLA